jgi:serine/threonine protein kinase
MIGTSLNQYRITASIGAGGMGEVFRARDTRLNRDVAVKVLPKDFASDADRQRRFEQEAKTLAALNHPNILTIHDAGVHEGAPYLVSELLRGQTLREVLGTTATTALPVRKATDYALQIAQGLAAAHGKGVVHRDLKPENIFVTQDGRVKILDFGLAKLREDPKSEIRNPKSAEPATIRIDADAILNTTEPGRVMGTPAYMSPEQVRGEPADHRADIFAFGCVLYEMFSGTRAFRRDTPVASMNAVLSEEPPDLATSRPDVPVSLTRIVQRCLQKQPERRFQSVHDLAFALEGITETGVVSAQFAAPPGSSGRLTAVVGVSTCALAIALLVSWKRWNVAEPDRRDTPATWLEITPPHQTLTQHPSPSVSPDGRQVTFYAPDGAGQIGLWLRSLDAPAARLLPGVTFTADAEGVNAPAWSPDGRSLAVPANGQLMRLDIAGGKPLPLAPASNPRGASWSPSGVIVFVPGSGQPAYQIPASGGEPKPLPGPLGHQEAYWPHFLPDGHRFLIQTTNGSGGFVIVAASLHGPEIKPVSSVLSRVEYADGYLFFGDKSGLFAQRFEEQKLTLVGERVRLTDELGVSFGDLSAYAFTASAGGTLVYWSGPPFPPTQLTWFTRSGERLATMGDPGEHLGFSLAPDGKQVVLERRDPKLNRIGAWLMDTNTGVLSIFGTSRVDHNWPAGTPRWSPAGDRILLAELGALWAKPLTGGEGEVLCSGNVWLSDISPDVRNALFEVDDPDTSSDIWIIPLLGDRTPKPYVRTKSNEYGSRFSPDGRWVAYVSDETGRFEAYVQSFPEPGRAVRVSTDGARRVEWRPDGEELVYLTAEYTLMAVAVNGADQSLEVGKPQKLFFVRTCGDFGRQQFQSSHDGQKFLINARVDAASPRSLNVLVNWQGLVKQQ